MKNEVTNWEKTKETDVDGNFKVYQQCFSNDVFVSVKPKASHPLILTNSIIQNYQPEWANNI